jgi:hypothetical protein
MVLTAVLSSYSILILSRSIMMHALMLRIDLKVFCDILPFKADLGTLKPGR